MSVLIVGSVALDTIKTPYGRYKEVLGGSATYSSVSASFFSPVNLVAVVGEDFPHKYRRFLEKRSIDLRGLEVKEGETFRWEGEYSWDFNVAKTISTHLNVFAHFSPLLPPVYRKSRYVLLANIDPELQETILYQIKNPRLVASDTMNYWIENKRKQLLRILKRVDLFLLNDSEARQLSGERNLLKAGRAICRFGPSKIVIKKGEHGVLLFAFGSVFSFPAYILEEVRDPTGAGDAFAGALIGYLAKSSVINNHTLKEGVVYGTIVASFTVEGVSLNKLAKIRLSDIHRRYKEFRKLTQF